MITDAIQSIIDPIESAYSPIVESDEAPVGTFLVHREEIQETLRDKEGIYGYIYSVIVIIVGTVLEEIDSAASTIIGSLDGLEGTYEQTVIEESNLVSSIGATWNDEEKSYTKQLMFSIQTQNL